MSRSESSSSSSRMAWGILGLLAVIALLMGGLLWANYSRFLSYVRETLEAPEEPLAWEQRPFSSEACVDAALEWAARCRGVKSLCDEYVTRVTSHCLSAGGEEFHRAYCEEIGTLGALTHFGYEECRARGARRHVDAEPCAMAYRSVDSWCHYVRDHFAGGTEPGAAPVQP